MERPLILWKEKTFSAFEEKEMVTYLTIDILKDKAEEDQ